MSWSRAFDEPIQPPKGKALVTLKDAAEYILALPKSKQESPEWQHPRKRLSWLLKITSANPRIRFIRHTSHPPRADDRERNPVQATESVGTVACSQNGNSA